MNLTNWRMIPRTCAMLVLTPLFVCAQQIGPQVDGSGHARLINSLSIDSAVYKVKPPKGPGPVPGCPRCKPPEWSIERDLPKVIQSGFLVLQQNPEDVNAALALAERLSRDFDKSLIDHAARANLIAAKLVYEGKRPAGISDQDWNKNEALARCLQNLGYIAALKDQVDEALRFYEQAAAQNNSDSFNYLAIGSIRKYKFNVALTRYIGLVNSNAGSAELNNAWQEAIAEADQTAASLRAFMKTSKPGDGATEFAVGAQEVLRTFSDTKSKDFRKTLNDVLLKQGQRIP